MTIMFIAMCHSKKQNQASPQRKAVGWVSQLSMEFEAAPAFQPTVQASRIMHLQQKTLSWSLRPKLGRPSKLCSSLSGCGPAETVCHRYPSCFAACATWWAHVKLPRHDMWFTSASSLSKACGRLRSKLMTLHFV